MTSPVGPGRASDNRALVLAAPKGTVADLSAPQVSELTHPDVLDITYLLFPDGFDHQTEVTKFQTGRYTLAQVLENEGTVKDSFVLKYPYLANDTDVLRTKFLQGTEWDIFERLVEHNDQPLADGQVFSIAAPVRCGMQREIPRTANTEIGKIQDLLVTGKVERDVILGGAGVTGWELEVTGAPTGGTYTLVVNGLRTAPIAHGANAAAVKAAIDGLSGVTGITVTASGSAPMSLVFSAKVSLSADDSALTGGTDPAVVVTAA